ncbi:signal recognition particle, SRP9/SRP14 subunit [Podospora fimiseda]|uniref:Signal recognition particle subunit SRP14 n=1 Tax=Podospora fimiseda TaxID=252190 RepID=A0AAN7H0U3_9PEZI|nr:signal recognition particle, SRP9/SRP14 subunit [Podospora fimiseda]
MNHLTHDEFFTALTTLFPTKSSPKGTIILSQKRFTFPQQEKSENPLADLNPSDPLPLIIHATNAKSKSSREKGHPRTKLSTIVQPDELEGFYAKYAEVCKAGMSGFLKPRDRTKRKAKAKGKKKKTTTVAA